MGSGGPTAGEDLSVVITRLLVGSERELKGWRGLVPTAGRELGLGDDLASAAFGGVEADDRSSADGGFH